ncbi:MAG: porin family protein [Chitinophagaceae bacterium]
MKKILLPVLFIACTCAARSQVLIAILFGDKLNTDKLEFGLIVSPGLVNITDIQSKSRAGLNLGLYFNIKINDRLFLHPELIPKAAFGARSIMPYSTGNDSLDNLFTGGSIQRNIKAMSLPLLVHYRIKKLLFAEAGIQVDWLLRSKDVFKNEVDGNDLTYTTKINDKVTMFDVGVVGGLLYKFKKDKGMGLGIRYFYGLTDIHKDLSGNQRNTAWLLNVTIPIGTGKQQAAPPPQSP